VRGESDIQSIFLVQISPSRQLRDSISQAQFVTVECGSRVVTEDGRWESARLGRDTSQSTKTISDLKHERDKVVFPGIHTTRDIAKLAFVLTFCVRSSKQIARTFTDELGARYGISRL
jgi:hypothetical protein